MLAGPRTGRNLPLSPVGRPPPTLPSVPGSPIPLGRAQPPPFIHLLSHSIFSSFALNVYYGSGCCGDGRERGAKHWRPGSFTEWKVSQQVTCSARLGLWRCSPQCSHRLPRSHPLHLSTNTIISFSLLPQTTKVHTTKPTLFTTEPGFSFWNVGEWMLLTGTGCSR